MTNVDEFFATVQGPKIDRDRYDRPLIKQPDGSTIPYTRASTFAEYLSEAGGLITYNKRYAALGMARNPDLAELAAAYEYGDPDLDELIKRAMDRVGANAKADYGTAVHAYTAPEGPRERTPKRMKADVDSYHAALAEANITIVDSEKFVVCDELRVAGSYDNVLDTLDLGMVVSDKKTGKVHPDTFAIQLGVYAHGRTYDPETGERGPMPAVRQDIGILVHIPAGEGKTELYKLDIAAGWDMAINHTRQVKAYRERKDLVARYVPQVEIGSEELADLIATAHDRQAIVALWERHNGSWTPDHSALAAARLALLKHGLVT